MTALAALGEWISRPTARKIVGLGETAFNRLVAEGRISARKHNRGYARFSTADVERVAADGSVSQSRKPMRF